MSVRRTLKSLKWSRRLIPTIQQLFSISVILTGKKHCPSFWKFNSSLAEDAHFVTLLSESMPTWLDKLKEITDERILCDLSFHTRWQGWGHDSQSYRHFQRRSVICIFFCKIKQYLTKWNIPWFPKDIKRMRDINSSRFATDCKFGLIFKGIHSS